MGVIGALLMGESVNTAAAGGVHDGLRAWSRPRASPRSTIGTRTFSVVRAGLFGGIRALTFTTVRGFDAVDRRAGRRPRRADSASFAGPSIWESQHAQRLLPLGRASTRESAIRNRFSRSRMLAEGRADRAGQRWDGVVAFGKVRLVREALGSRNAGSDIRVLAACSTWSSRCSSASSIDEGGLPGFHGFTMRSAASARSCNSRSGGWSR